MEAKKLLADENKKQRVKQNKYVSWVLYVKFRIEKHRLVNYFAFLENVCYQYSNCVPRVTSCFIMSCRLARNDLSWKVAQVIVVALEESAPYPSYFDRN